MGQLPRKEESSCRELYYSKTKTKNDLYGNESSILKSDHQTSGSQSWNHKWVKKNSL